MVRTQERVRMRMNFNNIKTVFILSLTFRSFVTTLPFRTLSLSIQHGLQVLLLVGDRVMESESVRNHTVSEF